MPMYDNTSDTAWLGNTIRDPPKTYGACVGLCKIGRWGVVKECWNNGKSRQMIWYLRPLPMRFIGWDRQGAFLGRRRKVT